MTSLNQLEREIEETRARLDSTIDRLQNRLSPSGVVDEVLGTVRRSPYGGVLDETLGAIRRNPVPVLLVAAGIGLLFHRMSEDARRARRQREAGLRTRPAAARFVDPVDDPVDNPVDDPLDPLLRPREPIRPYDPDLGPANPATDPLAPRRTRDARA